MSILRADSIRDRAGTGAPDFPNGLTGNVTGTATTATNAQGLTGTPNITVGTVTGTDATFSGNLTVQGTTTTIDTAITEVDSLAVDGSVGIGTTNPATLLHLASYTPYIRLEDQNDNQDWEIRAHSRFDIRDITNDALRLSIDSTGRIGIGTNTFNDSRERLRVQSPSTETGTYLTIKSPTETGRSALMFGDSDFNEGRIQYEHSDNSMQFFTNDSERLSIASGGTAIFKAGLAEKVNVKAQLTGANACAITSGNVILTTTNEPGNTYPNITGVHSVLASGEGFSVTIALKVNGSGTINGFHIDGVSQTVEWSGGSAPSAGGSGYDVFTFSAFKTGSGTTDYTVFGAATNYD